MPTNYSKLNSQYTQILKTRERIENLCHNGHLSTRDIKKLYSGLFINAVTSFEKYLEQIFLGQLVSPSSKVTPRFSVKSHKSAYEILSGDRPYIDWLPFKNTKDRAKRCFRSGFPFTQLSSKDESKIDAVSIIRNALAHNSRYANQKFEKTFSQLTLRQEERTPIGYLRTQFRNTPKLTYFELYIGELLTISFKLDV